MDRWASLHNFRPEPDFALLDRFVDELERWNKAVRLVGPYDSDGIAIQVADSLLPFCFAPPEFPLLDIGSGAGLPAIPIAATWKGKEILCVEPRSKRVSFIRHAARSLAFSNVKAACARAEDLLAEKPELAAAFPCVTARAVTDVQSLLALAGPYLKPGGRVILGRGGDQLPATVGWRLESFRKYIGPTESGDRSVAVFTKE